MKPFSIGRQTIGPGHPCYLIAEIGSNHKGEVSLALELIAAMAEAGASAVKFQKRDNRNLYTPEYAGRRYNGGHSYGPTYLEHRQNLELNAEELAQCRAQAEALGVEFLVTPFDAASAELCATLGVRAFKIASGDLTNEPLIRHLAGFGLPLIASTGAASEAEIVRAHGLLQALNIDFALLYAVAAYPPPVDQLNLARLRQLQACFPKTQIGFSGHDQGIQGAVYARVMGATVIEKHVTLNRSWKGTDHGFSLLPDEVRQLVDRMAEVDQMMGVPRSGSDPVEAHERAAREKMGKGIYAVKSLRPGTRLTADLLCFKSPGGELTPADLSGVLGKVLTTALDQHAPLRRDHLCD